MALILCPFCKTEVRRLKGKPYEARCNNCLSWKFHKKDLPLIKNMSDFEKEHGWIASFTASYIINFGHRNRL